MRNSSTKARTARDLCRQIVRHIRRFDRECARNEHTDTGAAWELLHDCADRAMRAARVIGKGART